MDDTLKSSATNKSNTSTTSSARNLFDSISPLVNVMKYIRKRQGLEYNFDVSLSTEPDEKAKKKLGFVRD